MDNSDDKLFKKALESASNPQLQLSNKKKNTRRKHRNSHLGCGTCKKRRIKCDETLPSCLNCLKGKLHCAYLNLDSNARNALLMAQYNQNLRHDNKSDDDSKDEMIPQPLPPHLSNHLLNLIPPILSVLPGGVPNGLPTSQDIKSPNTTPNVSTTKSSPETNQTNSTGNTSSPTNHNSNQSMNANATINQTPYGPLVQVQTYSMPNVVYSSMGVPVQVQSVPQVVQVPLPILQNQLQLNGLQTIPQLMSQNSTQVPVSLNQQQMVVAQAQAMQQAQAVQQAQAMQAHAQVMQQQAMAHAQAQAQAQAQQPQPQPQAQGQPQGQHSASLPPPQQTQNLPSSFVTPTIQIAPLAEPTSSSLPPPPVGSDKSSENSANNTPPSRITSLSSLTGSTAPSNHITTGDSSIKNERSALVQSSDNSSSTVLNHSHSVSNLSGIRDIRIKSESPENQPIKLPPINSEDKVPTISKLLS